MGGCHRRLIAEYYSDDQYLNDPVVRFPNETSWQLTNQISGKPWEGTYEIEREELEHGEDWQPFEEHAVYECVQVQGPQLGTVAIMKVRFEVPEHLPPNHDPQERAKHASGMRLNFYTSAEIRTLERLTAAGCSATPTLLAVKVDTQDALNQPGLISPWWMPGGYIVYILMARIPAQSLDITSFWIFSQNERDEVRSAFRKAYTEVLRNGIIHKNAKLENLMWDKTNRKCYIIDLEMALYDPAVAAGIDRFKHDSEYFWWNLARSWKEPNW